MGLKQKMEKKNAALIKTKAETGGYNLTKKEKELLKKYYPNSIMNQLWEKTLAYGQTFTQNVKELRMVLVKKCVKKDQREHQQIKLLGKAKHRV